MDILFIRHSIAEPYGPAGGDAGRPLTQRGRQMFDAMSRWLYGRGVQPEKILFSARVRAVETAKILADAGGRPQMTECEWLGERFEMETLLTALRKTVAETVAIVGHEPDMSRCTQEMFAGGRLTFTPGTIACVRFDGLIDVGQGRLVWFLSPELFMQ